MDHHVLGVVDAPIPDRLSSLWRQWRREVRCRKQLGHCWHAGNYWDWRCCACAGSAEGSPVDRCQVCAQARMFEEWRGNE